MNPSVITKLQEWYAKQCNGDWEHSWGVKIDTLDNPGWTVTIDLRQTKYENIEFPKLEHGNGDNDTDWIMCWIAECTFRGLGDPSKLEKILEYFLENIVALDAASS